MIEKHIVKICQYGQHKFFLTLYFATVFQENTERITALHCTLHFLMELLGVNAFFIYCKDISKLYVKRVLYTITSSLMIT